ncbi:MAG: hypothetical protein H6907_03290 [Hyphomicrobiales bacterium]|nr:hypothetical protein [Hyphomicrobiales bacterium]MCP5370732.1 hypothetical protein [Hyphomicrobiales bacterium]
MRRATRTLIGGPGLIVLALAAVAGSAATAQNVVVVADGTAPAARDAVTARLLAAGIPVYDRGAVLGLTRDRASPRLEAELVSAARASAETGDGPALRAAVVVRATPVIERSTYVTRARVRAQVRLLDLSSGRHLGQESGDSPTWRVPATCDPACLDRAVNRRAADLTDTLTARLLPVLATLKPVSPVPPKPARAAVATRVSLPPPPRKPPAPAARDTAIDSAPAIALAAGLTVVFVDFTDADAVAAEDYLAVFPGFRDLTLVAAAPGRRAYRYRSAAAVADLHDNLERMLRLMRLAGRVEVANGTVTVTRAAVQPGANDW